MPATSPAQALGLILHGPAKAYNADIVLLDYRDPATFSALWLDRLQSGKLTIGKAADKVDINLTDSAKQYLIIGNDPPDGIINTSLPGLTGINFRSHFTATSWLAAWKVNWEGESTAERGRTQREEEETLPRIAVIDPRPAGNGDGVARALQTILSARDTNGHPLVPRATVLNAPNLEAICRWLAEESVSRQARQEREGMEEPPLSQSESNSLRTPRPLRETSESILSLLKSTIWNELTSNREQHHALSNVLGAFLLQAEVGETATTHPAKEVQEYLNVLLRICGTAPKPDRAKSDGWITERLRNQFDGALLIDDMADLWGGFLGTAFEGHSTNSLRTTAPGEFVNTIEGAKSLLADDSLNGLPKRLDDFLTSGRSQLSSTVLIPPQADEPASKPWDNFVLFLDLRLGLSAAFHSQLRRVGFHLLSLKDRSLPWLTDFSRTQFEAELVGGETDETLLPRLIALMDPTLPIVIFSSTHRTELIDPFRDYGNIITTFRKPILTGLTGDWGAIVEELQADFVLAIEQAAGILHARSRCAEVKAFALSAEQGNANCRRQKVELYFDESGNPVRGPRDPERFGVGGLFLIHSGDEACENFHRLVNQQLKWGVSEDRVSNIEALLNERSILPKEANQTTKNRCFQKIDEIAKKSGSSIGAFALSVEATNRNALRTLSDLLDPQALDNLYLSLLRECLEILLFHCPLIQIEQDEIEIYVADRQIPCAVATLGPWQDAFGIQAVPGGYRSMPFDGVFRILPPLLDAHRISANKIAISRALAMKLEYLEKAVERRNRIRDLKRELNNAPRGSVANLQNTLNQLEDAQSQALASFGTKHAPKQIHYVADWLAKVGKFLERDRLGMPEINWFKNGFMEDRTEAFQMEMSACRVDTPLDSIMRLPQKLPISRDFELSAERWLLGKASRWPARLGGEELRKLFSKSRSGSA